MSHPYSAAAKAYLPTLCRQPNLKFDVKVGSVASFDLQLDGNLFVRYYIPAGGGRRLRVDTREVPCAADPSWRELACFECRTDAPVPRGIVFELWWRQRPALLFGGTGRSRLLGSAELAWQDAAACKGGSLERWLTLSPANRRVFGGSSTAPKLLVELKIHAGDGADEGRVRGSDGRRRRGCDCEQCGWVGSEDDMFLAATFTGL